MMIRVIDEILSTIDVEKACNTYSINRFEVLDKESRVTYLITRHPLRGYSLCNKESHTIDYPFKNEYSFRKFIRELTAFGYEVYVKTEEDK